MGVGVSARLQWDPEPKMGPLRYCAGAPCAAAIVFNYDYGHMFCVLDDVFAKSVTGITGNG
jgi:hypothetical protein